MTYDVLFLDAVNPPYDGNGGQSGGTEQQTVRVAEALADNGLKVAVWNGVEEAKSIRGVRYANHATPTDADTLIALGGSPLFEHIKKARVIEWSHNAQAYETPFEVLCVSKWQRDEVWKGRGKIILPLLPKHLPQHVPIKGRYIYASAACKGLDATIMMWASLYHPDHHELVITNPGYDAHKVPKRLPKNVRYLGVLPGLRDTALEMAKCEGMFFVNTFPECAPVAPALAEAIGLRAHVLSKNPCGLTEMVTGGYLTSDPQQFISDFAEAPTYRPPLKHYGTINQWMKYLRETR